MQKFLQNNVLFSLYRWINIRMRITQWPMFATTTCKYYPSCSEYAQIAIQEDGILRGAFKSLWRILRCNPWSRGGIDFPHIHS